MVLPSCWQLRAQAFCERTNVRSRPDRSAEPEVRWLMSSPHERTVAQLHPVLEAPEQGKRATQSARGSGQPLGCPHAPGIVLGCRGLHMLNAWCPLCAQPMAIHAVEAEGTSEILTLLRDLYPLCSYLLQPAAVYPCTV